VSWSTLGPPSAETRLNRVDPLPAIALTEVDFDWPIASTGFWYIATGNGVEIKSRITDGP
jgi:hypothetical protein